jgi:hypothetical protein
MGLGIPILVDSEEFIASGNMVAVGAAVLFTTLFASLMCYQLALLSVRIPVERLVFGRGASLFLAFLQLLFLVFNTYYGINIAGVEDVEGGNSLLRTFFAAAQPDLIFLLMSVGIQKNRLFWLNAIIYGISLTMRGWIGGLYLIAIIWSIRNYPVSFSRRAIKYAILLLLIVIAILPIIVSSKWFIRAGGGVADAWNFLEDYGYSNYLVDCLFYVVNRFQHLSHAVLLLENSEGLNRAYQSGAFIPYYMDAAPQWLYMKLNGETIITFNKFIVHYLFNSNNLAYATNPGIAGWFFALQEETVFFTIYLIFITLFPLILILRYIGFKYFLLVNCFILIYLFHGWIGAYVNLVLYLAPLYFIGKSNPSIMVSHANDLSKKDLWPI